uniref:WGS project CAEQ00000000 data, annotated contig 2221 n=1 Tax=Trypanosoma congolense (strain IL3000) TaxID=1068625 RepID=F9WCF1_TRYCI|nr:unnamed protein product [Trypanosoma congolense IL3000]
MTLLMPLLCSGNIYVSLLICVYNSVTALHRLLRDLSFAVAARQVTTVPRKTVVRELPLSFSQSSNVHRRMPDDEQQWSTAKSLKNDLPISGVEPRSPTELQMGISLPRSAVCVPLSIDDKLIHEEELQRARERKFLAPADAVSVSSPSYIRELPYTIVLTTAQNENRLLLGPLSSSQACDLGMKERPCSELGEGRAAVGSFVSERGGRSGCDEASHDARASCEDDSADFDIRVDGCCMEGETCISRVSSQSAAQRSTVKIGTDVGIDEANDISGGGNSIEDKMCGCVGASALDVACTATPNGPKRGMPVEAEVAVGPIPYPDACSEEVESLVDEFVYFYQESCVTKSRVRQLERELARMRKVVDMKRGLEEQLSRERELTQVLREQVTALLSERGSQQSET